MQVQRRFTLFTRISGQPHGPNDPIAHGQAQSSNRNTFSPIQLGPGVDGLETQWSHSGQDKKTNRSIGTRRH